jgi:hypothetical protein
MASANTNSFSMENMESTQSSTMVVLLHKNREALLLEQLKSVSGMDDTTAVQALEDLRILARILLSIGVPDADDEKIINISSTIKNKAA